VVESVKVEVPGLLGDTETIDWLKLAVSPARFIEVSKDTVESKPSTLVSVIVEVAEDPALTLRLWGLAAIVKSGAV
jgi:hypothetical protein